MPFSTNRNHASVSGWDKWKMCFSVHQKKGTRGRHLQIYRNCVPIPKSSRWGSQYGKLFVRSSEAKHTQKYPFLSAFYIYRNGKNYAKYAFVCFYLFIHLFTFRNLTFFNNIKCERHMGILLGWNTSSLFRKVCPSNWKWFSLTHTRSTAFWRQTNMDTQKKTTNRLAPNGQNRDACTQSMRLEIGAPSILGYFD